MHPVGFEPTISAGERPKTYALDSAATGTGIRIIYIKEVYSVLFRDTHVLSTTTVTTQPLPLAGHS